MWSVSLSFKNLNVFPAFICDIKGKHAWLCCRKVCTVHSRPARPGRSEPPLRAAGAHRQPDAEGARDTRPHPGDAYSHHSGGAGWVGVSGGMIIYTVMLVTDSFPVRFSGISQKNTVLLEVLLLHNNTSLTLETYAARHCYKLLR